MRALSGEMYAGPLSPAWVPSAQPLLPIHSCVGQSLTEAHSAGCSGCWCSVCLQGDLPAPGPTAPTPKPHILMRTLEHRPVTHLGAARKPWPGVRLSVCVSTCPEKPAARGRGEPMYMCCSLAFPRLRGPRESSQGDLWGSRPRVEKGSRSAQGHWEAVPRLLPPL